MTGPIDGDLRVWWIPQLGMKSFFFVPVLSIQEGHRLCRTLAEYDLFQFENKVKPDYANVGGVQIFEDGEWYDVEEDQ